MTIRKFKLKLSIKKEDSSPQKKRETGQKRKRDDNGREIWCGKEIVNPEELRKKNREAQKKSRKKRKLAKIAQETELKELKEKNERLEVTVDVLTHQYRDQALQNKMLSEELDAMRASQRKLEEKLAALENARGAEIKKEGSTSFMAPEPATVFRTANSGLSQQRTFVIGLTLMFYIHHLASRNPDFLKALLAISSKTGIPLWILLLIILASPNCPNRFHRNLPNFHSTQQTYWQTTTSLHDDIALSSRGWRYLSAHSDSTIISWRTKDP